MDVHDEFMKWIIYLQDDFTSVTVGPQVTAIGFCGKVIHYTRNRDGKVLRNEKRTV